MVSYFLAWLALILLSTPVAFALLIVAVGFMLAEPRLLISAAQRMIAGVDSFPILAVPFFILTGLLMNTAGITERIFGLARTVVGHLTGGLGHVNVLASLIFSGMSGSAIADAGGLGQIEIRAMREAGYDDDFAGGVTAASCIIGPLVPPSIPMVLYGVIANTSIGGLFLAGVAPGLLSALSLMLVVWLIARKRDYPRDPRASIGEILRALGRAFLPLMTPVIIMGGIFGGIFTPTEAACVAAVYALFLGLVVYRSLSLRDLAPIMRQTATTTAVVCFIVAAASLFSWIVARERVPQIIAEAFLDVSDNPLVMLAVINVLLLVLGMIMETLAIMILLVPVLAPVTAELGIDPVHFGVVVVLNLMIGILTPPMGLGLYVVASVGRIPFERLSWAVLPFLLPLFGVLLITTYMPDLILWLPRVVMR